MINLGQLIQVFRQQLDDVAQPYLWSDDEVKLWINHAYREASERSRYFRVRAYTDLQAAVSIYPYSLIKNPLDLAKDYTDKFIDIENMSIDCKKVLPIGRNECCDAVTGTGRPRFYTLAYIKTIKFFAVPDIAYKAEFDLIYNPDTLIADTDECLLPESSCVPMLYWAYKLATEKHDSDTVNKLNMYYEDKFISEFGHRHQLIVRLRQRLHNPPRW
jgi:hypothetical protein